MICLRHQTCNLDSSPGLNWRQSLLKLLIVDEEKDESEGQADRRGAHGVTKDEKPKKLNLLRLVTRCFRFSSQPILRQRHRICTLIRMVIKRINTENVRTWTLTALRESDTPTYRGTRAAIKCLIVVTCHDLKQNREKLTFM